MILEEPLLLPQQPASPPTSCTILTYIGENHAFFKKSRNFENHAFFKKSRNFENHAFFKKSRIFKKSRDS